VRVTWHDALAYCAWLTETLREWPAAPQTLTGLLRDRRGVFTLPSEAEWEKAARGAGQLPDGSTNPNPDRVYPWGDEFDSQSANTVESGIGAFSAVGCFPNGASPYGVLDLSGNVWEWTRSLWGKDLQKPAFKYPYDPNDTRREDLKAPRDVFRVLRGGSWDDGASFARCAYRNWRAPDDRYYGSAFRCVLRFP
jgi:formylglycine-generating enzyme required for sulfatase activity